VKILIAGASGMIGSTVAPYLAGQGHALVRLVRRGSSPQITGETGFEGEVCWDPDAGTIDAAGLEGLDGVLHVASRRWPDRWTATAKQQIRANHVGTIRLLAEALAGCRQKPGVLICASGMGIYPACGDQALSEESPLGSDFLARLQQDGEAAAAPAADAGIRVAHLRLPGVLGGTNLRSNLGRLGSGRQWMSWVARDELGSLIAFILENEAVRGPVNAGSPNPVRNAEFSQTLSRVLGKRPGRPIPAFLLRLMAGEMADALILASRRMQPCKLLAAGYAFRFPELERALRHELGLEA
jgi:uncharacterized protein